MASNAAALPSQFSNTAGVRAAVMRAKEHVRPPPNITPSEWAERGGVRIPAGNAKPGPYRLANAPYQREPADQLVNPDCNRVSLMWGAQVGKTLLALIQQGFAIEVTPRSQMMMQPSQGDLTTWLETKFNPLVAENAKMRGLIAKPRGRDGVNNQKMKSYPGGFMMFAWAGSPKTMRGRSAPLIVCDEVDGYVATEEGHPVGLLSQRSATFGDERMLVEISTPTVKGESYIEKAYDAGDQRRFYLVCPDCDHHQTLKWDLVRWDGRRSTSIDDADQDQGHDDHDPTTAAYVCEECGVLWDDGKRVAAIRNAEELGAGWKASKPFKGHASYHLNEMYSTFRKMRDIVQSYLDKLATDDLQTFVNVSLSQTYELKGERADPDTLLGRAQASGYATGQVPAGGLFLSAGIDQQEDRLEVEIVAWGEGEQSWSVDYRVLWGAPEQGEVWEDLEDLLAETFPHEYGVHLPISSACLDTGGSNGMTQAAYDYARGRTGRRLFAIKGMPGWGRPIVEKPQRKQSGKNARKVDLFLVGVDEAKLVTMRRLGNAKPGPGYCHFPMDRDEAYFKGLTAEKMVTKYIKGQPVREWHKPDRARNEPLDCRNYAYAAMKVIAPSFKRLAEKMRALKPKDDLPAWAKKTADMTAKLGETLVAIREASNDNAKAAPEKPQEEAKPKTVENPPVIRSRRVLKSSGVKKGNWAKNF